LPQVIRYLQSATPDAMLTTLPNYNIVALWAKWLCGLRTRVVVCEGNTTSRELLNNSQPFESKWPALMHQWYPKAEAIVAVSDGVADDLTHLARIPRQRITTIFNGVDLDRVRQLASEPLTDPWFASGAPPVLLAVGRLAPQKDYPTLLKAFARVRAQRQVRLVILGEGPERRRLENMAASLGITADVKMPGEAPNPFPFMARARLFVLSSGWEGLPTVLLEALACGCPVVSTDCPSGPSEILEYGALGRLVPVGDDLGLADAVLLTLNEGRDSDRLRKGATRFSLDRTVERYLEVLVSEHGPSDRAPLATFGLTDATSERRAAAAPGPDTPEHR
jgi:glycosyltransferase involved in cell wall biosynthesis